MLKSPSFALKHNEIFHSPLGSSDQTLEQLTHCWGPRFLGSEPTQVDSNEGPNKHEHNSKLLPKNPLKHHETIIEKHAREGWTGHFRRQVRRPKVPPEPKVRQVRRHLRRPKLPDRGETHACSAAPSAAESPRQRRKSPFGGKLRQPKAASTSMFGGRKFLRLPNLVSPLVAETQLFYAHLPPKLTNQA